MESTTLSLRLTELAASRLAEFISREPDPSTVGLRVYIQGGGCSGFRYGMMLEDAPMPSDITLVDRGVKVYVDERSAPMLAGAEIDYVDTLMGAGFTVNNPNAVAACGCGSSFRTADAAGSPGSCGSN